MTLKSMMVRIGGDPSGLETAFKKADGLIQKHSEKFKKAGRAMTVAGAAIVGSLGLMVKGYVKAGDEVHKMALRTSFTTEALSELKYAAEISGASLSDVEKGVKKMSKTIVDAEDGLATYIRAFERIGLTSEELMALSPEEQFDKISQAIARVENPTIRAAAAQDIFGRAGTKLLPLFAEGEQGLEALRAKAREMGIVFDQEAANKAAILNDSITTLKGSMQGVGISIASTLVPVITELTDKLSAIAIKVKDWTKEHPGLTEAIIKAVAAAGVLMTVFGPLLIMLPHLAAGFKTLKIAITTLTGPLGIVTGGLIFLTTRAYAAGAAFKSMSEALEEHAKVSGEKMGALKKAWYGVEAAYHKVFVGYDIGKVRTKALAEETAKLRAEQAAYGQVVLDSISGTKIYADAMTALEGGVVNAALGFLGLKIGTEETGKASKDWAAVLKGEGVQSIEAYKEEIKDLKDKKKLLKEALDAGAISLQTYRSEVESVNSKLDTLRGTTKAAKEEYIDFSKVIGDKSIPALITLDAELATLWGQLQSGAITWSEWADRAGALKEKADELSEGIGGIGMAVEDTEIEFEDAGDVIGGILGELNINTTGLADDMLEKMRETTTGMESLWDQLADGIQTKIASSWSDVLSGATSLKDALNGVWDSMKQQFFDICGSMLAKWTTDIVGGLLSGASTAASGILSSIGGAISSIFGGGGAAGGTAPGGGGGIGGLLGGAAGASPWGAVATGVGAMLGGIIGGGQTKGAIDATNRELHNIWAEARNCLNNLDNMKWILEDVKQALWKLADNLIPIADDIKHAAWSISDAIGNITTAQGGFHGSVLKPALIGVHPGERIDITPFSKMGGAQPITKIIYENHYYINALDSRSFEDALKRGPGNVVEKRIQKAIDLKNIRVPIGSVGR